MLQHSCFNTLASTLLLQHSCFHTLASNTLASTPRSTLTSTLFLTSRQTLLGLQSTARKDNLHAIEAEAQKYWDELRLYETDAPAKGDADEDQEKFMCKCHSVLESVVSVEVSIEVSVKVSQC